MNVCSGYPVWKNTQQIYHKESIICSLISRIHPYFNDSDFSADCKCRNFQDKWLHRHQTHHENMLKCAALQTVK